MLLIYIHTHTHTHTHVAAWRGRRTDFGCAWLQVPVPFMVPSKPDGTGQEAAEGGTTPRTPADVAEEEEEEEEKMKDKAASVGGQCECVCVCVVVLALVSAVLWRGEGEGLAGSLA